MVIEKEVMARICVIEVFKTNIKNNFQALLVQDKIERIYSHYQINFDLDDCDRILRIRSSTLINAMDIILIGKECGIRIALLEE